jgi:hypothetical protein
MEKDKKKFFEKLNKNVTSYLISFISYSEFKDLMLISHNFVDNIRHYIKYEVVFILT